MNAKHTPTPWETDSDRNGSMSIFDNNGKSIAFMPDTSETFHNGTLEEQKANAKRIVHCVNTHDSLIYALQQARSVINQLGALSGDKLYKHDLENIDAVLAKEREE